MLWCNILFLEWIIFSYYVPKSLENKGANTSVTLKMKSDRIIYGHWIWYMPLTVSTRKCKSKCRITSGRQWGSEKNMSFAI